MAVIRCSQGHYYDDEKFSRCPFCGVQIDLSALSAGKAAEAKRPEDDGKTVAASALMDGAGDQWDRTVSISAAQGVPDDDQKTIGIYSDARGNDPVTGWLVCVSGPERGRDHRLYHGFNRIGRGYGSQISIEADPTISRKNQCAVVYDKKSNTFFLTPTEGNQVCLNGEVLKMPQEIRTGDQIGIGQSVYEFVAFCREGRVWEDD